MDDISITIPPSLSRAQEQIKFATRTISRMLIQAFKLTR
jgi:hypothetical protein